MGKDSAAGIELGRSFQVEIVNEKVCGTDFVPLWDGTVMRCSLVEHKLLEAHKSEVMNLEHILVASANLMNRCETCSFRLIKY